MASSEQNMCARENIPARRYFFNLLVCAATMLVMAATAWAVGQTLTVQVREVQARVGPSFTSRPTVKLAYGQTVSVLEEQGAWIKARGAGGEGWVHQGALAERRLDLASGSRDAASRADQREVAAAGKGFTAETEKAYRQNNSSGYAQVEAMMRFNYSPAELQAFLAAGKIAPRQGATQ